MPKALIVGAGINGLCTAWALVKAGWQVEVFEAGAFPNPHAASTDHHRLIRSFYSDPGYAARIPAAFEAWDTLWADLGRSHYEPRGMLAVSQVEGDWSDQTRKVLDERGFAFSLMTGPELGARYPMLETKGVRYGMLTEDGGMLMATPILRDLAAWLAERGVVLRANTRVASVSETGTLVTAKGESFSADMVITATGVASAEFSEPMKDCHARRVTVLYVDPPHHWRTAWSDAPCWVDLGGDDDLWGMPLTGDLPMKLGFGAYTQPGDPETERTPTAADIETVLGAYRGRFKDIEAFTLREAYVNFYLMAPQEKFQLHQNGAHLAVSADSGHGFKFGALTGLDVAEAVITGATEQVARRMAGEV